MTLPFIALIFIFHYLPLFGWIYAFSDSMPGKISSLHFVGLGMFKRMFSVGSAFGNSLRNSLVMSFLHILLSPVPVIFALCLAEVKNSKVSRVVQTITSLPNFVSWVLVYAVFFVFFSSQGVINTVLLDFNLIKEPLNVLANEDYAWYFQALVGLWKTTGWSAIIYIAALAGVDRELYDAANVDGAGRFGKILHVSLPGLAQTYFVLLMLSIGSLLNTGFEQFYVFRNPSVMNKINVLDVYIYTQGISNMEFGYATAVGMARSLVSILLLLTVNTLSKRVRGESLV